MVTFTSMPDRNWTANDSIYIHNEAFGAELWLVFIARMGTGLLYNEHECLFEWQNTFHCSNNGIYKEVGAWYEFCT